MSAEQELAQDVAKYVRDPLGYAKFAFRWGHNELASTSGPRSWQAGILAKIGSHLQGKTWATPLQISVASGHGIGKTALIAMICKWAMDTCEDCRIVVTANTEPQLATKTWPEICKWFGLAITKHWFNVGATTISVKDKAHERLWRMDRIAWSENNTEAFAGLHNRGKRIVVIYDEASAISDKIWEVTEGALTDSDTEIIWIAFGNPTKNTGRFRECFGKFKHRWERQHIDSRGIEGTNKDQIDKWVADYGEDSDFVRVRVKGEFPRAGSSQFISGESVSEARKRKTEGFETLPKIISCDVARFGDDQTVFALRQGRKAYILKKLRGLDTIQVAERLIQEIDHIKPQGVVVDGDGLGAGVVDQLKHRGYECFEFHGGATPLDGAKYFNKRAEVWGMMREWMEEADIPDDPELEVDLTGPEYYFSNKNQIQLEKKEDMKARGLSSPDLGDAIAMTFGFTIAPPKRKVNYAPKNWWDA